MLGHLLGGVLQTLDKSDLVPRTGGQTVPGRLGDDGPQLEAEVMESSFPLPSSSLLTLPETGGDSLGPHCCCSSALPSAKALLLARSLDSSGPPVPFVG